MKGTGNILWENFVYFLLLIFSGANVQLSQMPAWVQSVSYWLPLSRGIAAARMLVDGAALPDVSWLLLGELGIGLLYGVVGYLLFTVFEVVARRRGTLEVF